MDIYIKPVSKASLSGQSKITVQDVAEVVADKKTTEKVQKIKLLDISAARPSNYLVRVTDIIKAIKKEYPGHIVINVGSQDTVVQYAPEHKRSSPVLLYLKVAFVALVLLIGSSTAIMSFHTDAQIPKVFENYYKIFYGQEKSNPLIIDIPYSIGLAAGIIIFYNHLLGKKLSNDPTPIEVEMAQYETEVNETMLDALNKERGEAP